MLRRRALVATALMAGAMASVVPAVSHAAVTDPAGPSSGEVRVVAAPASEVAATASALVSTMPLRAKAASVVMGTISTTDPAALHSYMVTTGIGGFILMGGDIPHSEQELRALTAALTVDPALPPLVATDEEGGDVRRLPWDGFPSALTLKTSPSDASRDAFAGRGALVLRSGIGVNFGVIADVTDDPGMFIYRRALGTTPQNGVDRVAAAVAGEGGEDFSTLKHFPGHGAAPGDSHAGIPSTAMPKAEWQATDALPFEAGIDAGAKLLMFGHLAYTAVDPAPASLSAEWHRIAREELGFTGVAITDDLGMLEASGVPGYHDPVANAVAALAAGNDMVLEIMFSTPATASLVVDAIVAAVERGALSPARLDEAATRVTQLRLELAADGRGLTPCADCAPVG